MHLTKELKIGKFQVVRRLGRGGMGVVYEAFDTSLHRRVAIKTLLAHELANPVVARSTGKSRVELCCG